MIVDPLVQRDATQAMLTRQIEKVAYMIRDAGDALLNHIVVGAKSSACASQLPMWMVVADKEETADAQRARHLGKHRVESSNVRQHKASADNVARRVVDAGSTLLIVGSAELDVCGIGELDNRPRHHRVGQVQSNDAQASFRKQRRVLARSAAELNQSHLSVRR